MLWYNIISIKIFIMLCSDTQTLSGHQSDIQIPVHASACIHVCMYTWMHIYIYIYTYVYVCIYIHNCVYIYRWVPLKLDFLEAWKSVRLKRNLAYPIIIA